MQVYNLVNVLSIQNADISLPASKLTLFVFLASLLVSQGLGAQVTQLKEDFTKQCEDRLGPTKIDVVVHPSPMIYRNDESVAQITARSSAFDNDTTLGLTESNVRYEVLAKGHTLIHKESGTVCARPEINIEIFVGPQTISIGNEFPTNTCSYQAVLEHELRHAQTNFDFADRLGSLTKEGLVHAYGQRVLYGTAQDLGASIDNNIKNEWIPWMKDQMKGVEYYHHMIDTPAERNRVNIVCNGEIPQLIQAARAVIQ